MLSKNIVISAIFGAAVLIAVIECRVVIRGFRNLAHGVKSDNATIINDKTINIKNFHYDGAGPDVYFWVGKGKKPHENGTKIADETGSKEVLLAYEGKDISLKLPRRMTFKDIDWISVWCKQYGINFGHLRIPKRLKVSRNNAEIIRKDQYRE